MGIPRSTLWALCCVLAFSPLREAGAQVQPCSPDPSCIVLAVSSPPGVFDPGEEVPLSITFRSAPADGLEGGADEIAAINFSLAIPGLELADCNGADENGITAAFTVPPEIAAGFLVFVENTTCRLRPQCLCPEPGQERDEFINVVFAGPRHLLGRGAEGGGILPDGELLGVRLRVRPDAPGTVRLHVFSAADDPDEVPLPPFAGFVTAGDRLAVDQTIDQKANASKIRVIDGQLLVSVPPTSTATVTATFTGSATPTTTVTATVTPTASASPTASATSTPTIGPSPTASATATITPTPDPNATPTPSATPSATAEDSPTSTVTAASTATPSVTPTATPSRPATATPTEAETPTAAVTATRTNTPQGGCPGDCNGDGAVRVDELVSAVSLALGKRPSAPCAALDRDGSGTVSVNELIAAVRAALTGCVP